MGRKKNIKIAGIVTLYNPTDKDIKNISTYIDDIEVLYVIDNTEEKDNKDRLPKNKKIKYIFNNENLGVATALNMGAEYALKDGYKYLLTMDQDTKFKKGVMDKLKDAIRDVDISEYGIVTPWQKTKLKIKKVKDKYDFPPTVMTSGNILNLDVYKEVGGFKDWMFIDGIDIEYCLNIRKHGYKILRVNDAIVNHELGDIVYKKMDNEMVPVSNHSAIRRYYIMRNNHYICDMYKEFDPNICWDLVEQKKFAKEVILFEKHKFKKIRNMIRGLRDYKRGIKGKYPYKN